MSYSHADKPLAAKLHRQLEAYRLPKRLVGTLGARGAIIPERLTPIFRDIDELPASDDLRAEIKAALAASECLIVLCSPSAKASAWVTREITLFKELHGETRPVFAAIIAGEPVDVLPDALMTRAGVVSDRVDPVAADFRVGQDGQKLALMKIVSGLTGASLGTLVQRDAQRRLRRVMAVTVMAAAIVLILASSLVLALRARAEAERNRNEAEGLVEYMLTDLRVRLKGVGRLDVMAAVNGRAMDHYTKTGALDSLPPESLNRRARILHAMGEDDSNGGNYGPAIEKFLAAYQTTEAVLAQRPNDADAIFAHAQSEYWVGYAAWQRNDRPTTDRYWTGYLKQAKHLLAVEPGSARALTEMGYAHLNLCDLNLRMEYDTNAAVQHCQMAVRYSEKALALSPGSTAAIETLANQLGKLADAQLMQKSFASAAQNRTREAALIDGLLMKDPQNVDLQFRALWAAYGQGNVASKRGDFAASAALLEPILRKLDGLATRVGKQPDTLFFKTKVLLTLASDLRQLGNQRWATVLAQASATIDALKAMDGNDERAAFLRTQVNTLEKEGRL